MLFLRGRNSVKTLGKIGWKSLTFLWYNGWIMLTFTCWCGVVQKWGEKNAHNFRSIFDIFIFLLRIVELWMHCIRIKLSVRCTVDKFNMFSLFFVLITANVECSPLPLLPPPPLPMMPRKVSAWAYFALPYYAIKIDDSETK